MKRYNMEETGTDHHSNFEMLESGHGEWVKFDDIEDYVSSRITNVLLKNANHIKSIDFFSMGYAKMIDELGSLIGRLKASSCNCEENSYYRSKEHFDGIDHWICPAHGYKKL